MVNFQTRDTSCVYLERVLRAKTVKLSKVKHKTIYFKEKTSTNEWYYYFDPLDEKLGTNSEQL